MKKTIRLTENDLNRIVKKVLTEELINENMDNDEAFSIYKRLQQTGEDMDNTYRKVKSFREELDIRIMRQVRSQNASSVFDSQIRTPPDVIESVIPFRRESKFTCMHHTDEGFVGGKWVKGETTARNEKRFVTEMQQGLINYKEDGLNNILNVMDIDNIDVSLYPNTKFINVKMK
jgi:hypothetical protein